MKGDVCILREAAEGKFVKFYAAIVNVSSDSLTIKRLFSSDSNGSRHLITDVTPTGMEYAAFLDSVVRKIRMTDLVRVIGRLSRRDMTYL